MDFIAGFDPIMSIGASIVHLAVMLASFAPTDMWQGAPPFDPTNMLRNLVRIIGQVALWAGALGLALYAISEVFNDRRDMRNVVLSVIGIVALIVIAINADGIIRWLAQQMGASV